MNVFLPCNYTGILYKEFDEHGHNVWSCDLLDAENIYDHHIQDDCLKYLNGFWFCPGCNRIETDRLDDDVRECWCERPVITYRMERIKWDIMVAYGPPCTHLSKAGARYWREKQADGRQQAAIDFVMALWNAPIPRICIENPVGKLTSIIGKPSQIINPWEFGDPYLKSTCLWLKGLPQLMPMMSNRMVKPKQHWICAGKNRKSKLPNAYVSKNDRGRSFTGICKAMAEQWG